MDRPGPTAVRELAGALTGPDGSQQRIYEHLGLPCDPDRLPAFKAAIRPPEATARRLYTPRSRQLVREAYHFELRYFGHKFP